MTTDRPLLDPPPSERDGLRRTHEPSVSIVIPTLQEEGSLGACLESLLRQDYANVLEILVVDGGSEDSTRDIARGFGDRVTVVDNPGVTAASAMNIGIAAAAADVIVRIDAHSEYASDYVSCGVRALVDSGAIVAGGPMRPVGRTPFGEAVALVTSSPFGVGPGKFHYSNKPEKVDTVYLGVFYKVDIEALGGYDTDNLQWAAEDQELNFRVRQAGGFIWLDPAIRSTYEPRSTPRALARQYRNYGLAKASTLKKHGSLPTLRPLAPAAVVVLTAAGVVVGLVVRSAVVALAFPAAYLVGIGVASAWIARGAPRRWPRVVAAMAICHWGHGSGFVAGLFRILRGGSFDSTPKGRRRV